MLYHLLYPLHTEYSFFNVFRYVTFRTASATLTAPRDLVPHGPVAHRPVASVSNRPTHPPRRPGGPPLQGGDADDGRCLDLDPRWSFPRSLWADLTNVFVLGRARHHGRVRAHRLHRRLLEDRSQAIAGAFGAGEDLAPDELRRRHRPRAVRHVAARRLLDGRCCSRSSKSSGPSSRGCSCRSPCLVLVGASNAVNLHRRPRRSRHRHPCSSPVGRLHAC